VSLVLTESISCSFIDRDMFMRHFGHGIGHLQSEWQHEIEPKDDISLGRTLDNDADSSDDLDAGDSDPDEPEVVVAVDSDEEEAETVEYNGKNVRVDDEEGDTSDITISDSDSDCSNCDLDGYASY
jgi:hypothetical protein